jgi:hypothetical protein
VNKLNAEAASTGGGADDGPLPFPEAKAMRETYLAKIARMEYQVRAGTLLERSAAVREWASALRDLRARLLAVPARCGAVLPHLDKSEVEVIAREIRAALAELAGGDNAGEARAAAFRVLAPPPHLKLSEWLEKELRLPATSAQPGPIRLWPFQRAIADAIGDPAIERVTVVKPTRIVHQPLDRSDRLLRR